MWTVKLGSKTYKLNDAKATKIQHAYMELLDAVDSMRSGAHQVLMAVVQKAGIPVRSFGEAEKVAAQL
jgi:hypothetical protein